jgi:DNA polymerase III epsilon subunit-like protein
MKRKLLFLDFETGGIEPEIHAVCSLGAVVVHEGFIDETYYSVINDPEGVVTTVDVGDIRAASVTHGLSPEHRAEGKSPGQVIEDLEQLFMRHDMRLPRKVTLGGHHTQFDIGFLKRLYWLAKADYSARYERRFIDTMAGAYCLEQAGRIETYGPPSLVNVCKAVGVPLLREGTHNALDDAVAAAKVWARMVTMIRHTEVPAHPIR